MKKVLFISYQFPPSASANVYRTIKFIKYLPQFDWAPVVLTVHPTTTTKMDYTLAKELPQNILVHKSTRLNYMSWPIPFFIKKLISLPDDKVGWIPSAVNRGYQIIKRYNLKAIYTASPPYSTSIIGLILKFLTKLPLIIDCRDPWTNNFLYTRDRFIKNIEQTLEKHIYLYSDAIIANNDYSKNMIANSFNLESDKIFSIPSGYNEDDFGVPLKVTRNSKMQINYIGNFYGSYNPALFCECIDILLQKVPAISNEIEINFVGNCRLHQYDLSPRISHMIKDRGFVQYNKCIEYMMNADVLLLVLPRDKSKYCTPQKIYQYIRSAREILAIIPPDGEAARILRLSNVGCITGYNRDEIVNAMLSLYEKWKKGKLNVSPNFAFIKNFERRNSTQKLSRVFDLAIANKCRRHV